MTVTTDHPQPAIEVTDPQRPQVKRRPGLNTDTLALVGVFIAMFAFAAAIIGVGIASRALDEHKEIEDAIASGRVATSPSLGVELSEFAIGPGSIQVPAGGGTLDIENVGAIVHNLSVDGVASPMLASGDSATLDLTALTPGTYTMRCDVPGHAAAGMTGTLTIG